jgi:phosphatidylglycerol:prolipoprotein diacylglycerol transferase
MRPILFEIGPVTIYSYGVFFLLGNVLWLGLTVHEARRRGRSWDEIFPVAMAVFVGTYVGARLSHVLIEPERADELLNFYQMFNPAQGGRNLVGAFVGGTLLGTVMRRRLEIESDLFDAFAPGIPLGIAVGRIGCLLGGCCYGKPTTWPWAITLHGAARHPTQVYDGLVNLLLFWLVWRLRDRLPRRGDLLGLYVWGYALARFWIEFVRVNPPFLLGLTMPQVACLLALGGLTPYLAPRWSSLALALRPRLSR